eukprot:SAG31_NODE_440_length_15664_cov_8.209252_14_plen_105_part_01
MYVVEDGTIELSRHSVVLSRLHSGSPFGEDALVGNGSKDSTGRRRRERTATAASDTDLIAMEIRDIGPVASEFPELERRLQEMVCCDSMLCNRIHLRDQTRLSLF